MNEYLPPDRADSVSNSEFTLASVALAEAWAHVVPGVHALHVERSGAGATCISALVNAINVPDSLKLWTICPEHGQASLSCIGAQGGQSRQLTVRSALDAVTPVTQEQWRSIEILAEAILAAWQPYRQESGAELKLAA